MQLMRWSFLPSLLGSVAPGGPRSRVRADRLGRPRVRRVEVWWKLIVLMGFMGAGKSTIGRLLAEKLGTAFIDVDSVIEQREKRTIREIFDGAGEAKFRCIEHRVTLETLTGPDAVVALGGGAVENSSIRDALAGAQIVYLEVDFEEAVRRTGHDTGRPVINRADVRSIYERRLSIYRSLATLRVPTDVINPEEVVEVILARLGSAGT